MENVQANNVDQLPRLVYYSDSDEFIAFKVELKADKVEMKSPHSSEQPNTNSSKYSSSSSTGSNLSLGGAQPAIQVANQSPSENTHNSERTNHESCILFKLSFPTIAYYQQIDNFTERSFISEHNVNLEITRVENK